MLAPIAAAALYLGGCGIITKDLEGNVRFDFEINGDDGESRYEDLVTFDPNSNEDVRNNRDSIESGSVLQISLELVELLPGNQAKMVAGQVDVKPQGAPDDQWILAVGEWSGIPLYTDETSNTPALGQVFKINLPVSTQNKLSELVFKQESPLDFRITGIGYDWYLREQGPVRLKGQVEVQLAVSVSAP